MAADIAFSAAPATPADHRAAMPAPASAIVVGDGIIGLACAVVLQQSGVAVTLIGPAGHPTGASIGNAGHIAIEQVEPLASRAVLRSLPRRLFVGGGPVSLPLRDIGAWLPFGVRLVKASSPDQFARGKDVLGQLLSNAFPAWHRLARAAGVERLLRRDGHYVLWESEATAAAGRAHWARTDIGEARWLDVTAAERNVLQDLLYVPVVGGIRFEGSGQITDLDVLARALHAAFRVAGGSFREGRVTVVTPESPAVTLADGDRVAAEAVLVAAGTASAGLVAPLGLRAPIIAERGYHIQAPAPGWPVALPPVVFEDRSIIATRFADGLRVAGFTEFAREQSPPDPRKWHRLRAHAAALGLPLTSPVREWMGARPTLPDYLPAIGRSGRHSGVFYAFGHQHLGLTLAATTAEAVAAMMRGVAPDFELAPLSLERFS
jgi:D-hydroxyproline dehydrogenase